MTDGTHLPNSDEPSTEITLLLIIENKIEVVNTTFGAYRHFWIQECHLSDMNHHIHLLDTERLHTSSFGYVLESCHMFFPRIIATVEI